MVLGAGNCQLNAIKKVQSMGHLAIASDNCHDSIGKEISDYKSFADTFSYEETLKEAEKFEIDGIMTSGTDQPVLTLAKVAKTLNLNSFLTPEVAYSVTHKDKMKKIFVANNIPTVDYVILNKDSKPEDINFQGPYVIKPIDSQGQRGIYKFSNKEALKLYLTESLQYSRAGFVLLESYYENKEITVSGYVTSGDCHVLTITDRVTFGSDEHIGVCLAHEYPSIHLDQYSHEIIDITHRICKAFDIQEGPIYFQMLVGNQGLKVNEIACRIGGAYEDIWIPYITGIDILKLNINGTLDKAYKTDCFKDYKFDYKSHFVSVQLFFCKPGTIAHQTQRDDMLLHDHILDIGYNYNLGDCIPKIENATQRAGYMVIIGESEVALRENIKQSFDQLKFEDHNNDNLVIRGKRWYREK